MSESQCSPTRNPFLDDDLLLSPTRSPNLASSLRSPALSLNLRNEMSPDATVCPLLELTQPLTQTLPDQTLPTPIVASSCALSKQDWYLALQQEKVQLPPNKRATMSQLYPAIWKMVSSLTKCWLTEKWEVPLKSKNRTDFKSKVVRQIVVKREKVMKDAIYDVDVTSMFPTVEKVYFYGLSVFMRHAEEYWKVDKASELINQETTVNDCIRIAGILAMDVNRDDLLSLNRGKHTLRSDVDNPLTRVDAIFHYMAVQFNDPAVHINQPERATNLVTYLELDPNEDTRIAIPRDFAWAKQVWKVDVLKPYNIAMKKWHKGTGGGPGAPEDYSNWENRDDELFAGYAKSGSSDMLAWIYMKDKDTGYAFNTINNPSPQSAITEDGQEVESITDSTNTNKSGRKTNTGIEHFGEMFASSMENGLTMIAKCMETNSGVREET